MRSGTFRHIEEVAAILPDHPGFGQCTSEHTSKGMCLETHQPFYRDIMRNNDLHRSSICKEAFEMRGATSNREDHEEI